MDPLAPFVWDNEDLQEQSEQSPRLSIVGGTTFAADGADTGNDFTLSPIAEDVAAFIRDRALFTVAGQATRVRQGKAVDNFSGDEASEADIGFDENLEDIPLDPLSKEEEQALLKRNVSIPAQKRVLFTTVIEFNCQQCGAGVLVEERDARFVHAKLAAGCPNCRARYELRLEDNMQYRVRRMDFRATNSLGLKKSSHDEEGDGKTSGIIVGKKLPVRTPPGVPFSSPPPSNPMILPHGATDPAIAGKTALAPPPPIRSTASGSEIVSSVTLESYVDKNSSDTDSSTGPSINWSDLDSVSSSQILEARELRELKDSPDLHRTSSGDTPERVGITRSGKNATGKDAGQEPPFSALFAGASRKLESGNGRAASSSARNRRIPPPALDAQELEVHTSSSSRELEVEREDVKSLAKYFWSRNRAKRRTRSPLRSPENSAANLLLLNRRSMPALFLKDKAGGGGQEEASNNTVSPARDQAEPPGRGTEEKLRNAFSHLQGGADLSLQGDLTWPSRNSSSRPRVVPAGELAPPTLKKVTAFGPVEAYSPVNATTPELPNRIPARPRSSLERSVTTNALQSLQRTPAGPLIYDRGQLLSVKRAFSVGNLSPMDNATPEIPDRVPPRIFFEVEGSSDAHSTGKEATRAARGEAQAAGREPFAALFGATASASSSMGKEADRDEGTLLHAKKVNAGQADAIENDTKVEKEHTSNSTSSAPPLTGGLTTFASEPSLLSDRDRTRNTSGQDLFNAASVAQSQEFLGFLRTQIEGRREILARLKEASWRKQLQSHNLARMAQNIRVVTTNDFSGDEQSALAGRTAEQLTGAKAIASPQDQQIWLSVRRRDAWQRGASYELQKFAEIRQFQRKVNYSRNKLDVMRTILLFYEEELNDGVVWKFGGSTTSTGQASTSRLVSGRTNSHSPNRKGPQSLTKNKIKYDAALLANMTDPRITCDPFRHLLVVPVTSSTVFGGEAATYGATVRTSPISLELKEEITELGKNTPAPTSTVESISKAEAGARPPRLPEAISSRSGAPDSGRTATTVETEVSTTCSSTSSKSKPKDAVSPFLGLRFPTPDSSAPSSPDPGNLIRYPSQPHRSPSYYSTRRKSKDGHGYSASSASLRFLSPRGRAELVAFLHRMRQALRNAHEAVLYGQGILKPPRDLSSPGNPIRIFLPPSREDRSPAEVLDTSDEHHKSRRELEDYLCLLEGRTGKRVLQHRRDEAERTSRSISPVPDENYFEDGTARATSSTSERQRSSSSRRSNSKGRKRPSLPRAPSPISAQDESAAPFQFQDADVALERGPLYRGLAQEAFRFWDKRWLKVLPEGDDLDALEIALLTKIEVLISQDGMRVLTNFAFSPAELLQQAQSAGPQSPASDHTSTAAVTTPGPPVVLTSTGSPAGKEIAEKGFGKAISAALLAAEGAFSPDDASPLDSHAGTPPGSSTYAGEDLSMVVAGGNGEDGVDLLGDDREVIQSPPPSSAAIQTAAIRDHLDALQRFHLQTTPGSRTTSSREAGAGKELLFSSPSATSGQAHTPPPEEEPVAEVLVKSGALILALCNEDFTLFLRATNPMDQAFYIRRCLKAFLHFIKKYLPSFVLANYRQKPPVTTSSRTPSPPSAPANSSRGSAKSRTPEDGEFVLQNGKNKDRPVSTSATSNSKSSTSSSSKSSLLHTAKVKKTAPPPATPDDKPSTLAVLIGCWYVVLLQYSQDYLHGVLRSLVFLRAWLEIEHRELYPCLESESRAREEVVVTVEALFSSMLLVERIDARFMKMHHNSQAASALGTANRRNKINTQLLTEFLRL
ncbi:unnamed protein product [Amoebophrya sp. A120]|nr:unnamed protein product [Amoebophrya sp. A120]|eukprot:GSA120T00005004001.1